MRVLQRKLLIKLDIIFHKLINIAQRKKNGFSTFVAIQSAKKAITGNQFVIFLLHIFLTTVFLFSATETKGQRHSGRVCQGKLTEATLNIVTS